MAERDKPTDATLIKETWERMRGNRPFLAMLRERPEVYAPVVERLPALVSAYALPVESSPRLARSCRFQLREVDEWENGRWGVVTGYLDGTPLELDRWLIKAPILRRVSSTTP